MENARVPAHQDHQTPEIKNDKKRDVQQLPSGKRLQKTVENQHF